jgi:hypothetical protein
VTPPNLDRVPETEAPLDPATRIKQAAEQVRLARQTQGEARLSALQLAWQLNPYALKARYGLAIALLRSRQLTAARGHLNELAQWLPEHAALKYYRAVAAIQDGKKGDLEEAANLLSALEKVVRAGLNLPLTRLELALRRGKKNRPLLADWLAWLEQVPLHSANVPIIVEKCAKFFMERDEVAEGDQVLAWLDKAWRAQFAAAPLLTVLPSLHHIKYWPRDRWLPELREQVFDDVAGDLVCLFILDGLKKDEQGRDVPEERQLEILRTLLGQLPGASGLAYHYLAVLNASAKKRLLTDGDGEGALTVWREAVRLDRFNTLVQFNMALAEARQGRTREYYTHWRSALRLALARWELCGDRHEWELCAARAEATATKLRENIETAEREKQDVSPAVITAWLNYLDLYALLRQLSFEHPYHQLGVSANAPGEEVRRVAQVWLANLAAWETRQQGGALAPIELIVYARARIQRAVTISTRIIPSTEEVAFQAYCRQRAQYARDVFFMLTSLVNLNRFEETRHVMEQLTQLPLTTLEPYLAGLKVQSDEGEISFAELITVKELTARAASYAARAAEYLAEEGDDQELLRQMKQLDSVPWAQLDEPDEIRRKTRERMAFAVVASAAFDAIHDDRWADAIPFVEAGLRRLPDQLDLLWLAAFVIFRSVEEAFEPDSDQAQWAQTRAALQRASGYYRRATQVAPAAEVAARFGDLSDALQNALKTATDMETPRGQALRQARKLLKQEQWSQAYQVLNRLAAKDHNAEVEFYLGLAIYREIQSQLASDKQRPALGDLQSRLEKAANHLRAASRQSAEGDLNEVIADLAQAVNDMLEQVKYALTKDAAMDLMKADRWNEAYLKLDSLKNPDADILFFMALCRFRGVIREFNEATAYNRPSIPQAIKRLEQALDHIRVAKRTADEDDLKSTLDNLETSVRENLNVLKTM